MGWHGGQLFQMRHVLSLLPVMIVSPAGGDMGEGWCLGKNDLSHTQCVGWGWKKLETLFSGVGGGSLECGS